MDADLVSHLHAVFRQVFTPPSPCIILYQQDDLFLFCVDANIEQSDVAGSGVVQITEIINVLESLQLIEASDRSRLEDLLSLADKDKDGCITFEDFRSSFESLLVSAQQDSTAEVSSYDINVSSALESSGHSARDSFDDSRNLKVSHQQGYVSPSQPRTS